MRSVTPADPGLSSPRLQQAPVEHPRWAGSVQSPEGVLGSQRHRLEADGQVVETGEEGSGSFRV